MERQDPHCFINQRPRNEGRTEVHRASLRTATLMAALFSTTVASASPAPANPIGQRYMTHRDEPDAECAEPMHVDGSAERAQVSKKRHKQKVIHQQIKRQPTGKMAAFFERVTDPNKEERLTEFLKDPFRGLNHR